MEIAQEAVEVVCPTVHKGCLTPFLQQSNCYQLKLVESIECSIDKATDEVIMLLQQQIQECVRDHLPTQSVEEFTRSLSLQRFVEDIPR